MKISNTKLFVVLVLAGSLAGCGPSPQAVKEAAIKAARESVLVESLPESASSLEQLLEQDALDSVTLVARIYGGKLEPFDREKASFTVTVLPDLGHSHDDPSDCPFCKRKADNAPFAVVEIRGEDGELIQTPADELLDIAKNQDVVVTGKATKLDDMIVISADSVARVADLEAAHKLVAVVADEDTSEEATQEEG